MGINKVNYGNTTLIDISNDTVTADKLAQGYTAHDNTGAAITGTMSGASLTGKTVTPSASLQVITPNDSNDATLTDISLHNTSGETATATVSLPIVNGKTYRIYGQAKYTWSSATMTMTFDDEWVCGEPLPYTESGSAPQSPTITLTPTQLSLYDIGSLNFTLQSLAIIDPDASYNGLSAVVVKAVTSSGPTIKTATARLTSTSYSISFTNVVAAPKAFFVISTETLNPTSSSGAYITEVEYDGDSVVGSRLRTASNKGILTHTEDVYTFSYSNGTLTITNPQGSASSGRFYYGYKLTYIY